MQKYSIIKPRPVKTRSLSTLNIKEKKGRKRKRKRGIKCKKPIKIEFLSYIYGVRKKEERKRERERRERKRKENQVSLGHVAAAVVGILDCLKGQGIRARDFVTSRAPPSRNEVLPHSQLFVQVNDPVGSVELWPSLQAVHSECGELYILFATLVPEPFPSPGFQPPLLCQHSGDQTALIAC